VKTKAKRKKVLTAKAKESVALKMYKSVAAYVEANGGKVLVAGGIQIIQWPGGSEFNFTVGIRCTGRIPKFAAPGREGEKP
jgi:hypothetical protein